MAWVFGNYYRWRVVQGQVIIKTLPNEKRTRCVEVLCECTAGDQKGQRLKFTTYINTRENAARSRRDLQNMGWIGTRWGDWTGLIIGTREFEAKVLADGARDGSDRVFPRLAFPIPKRSVDTENMVSEEELDKINEELGDMQQLDAIAEAMEHDRKNGTQSEEVSFP